MRDKNHEPWPYSDQTHSTMVRVRHPGIGSAWLCVRMSVSLELAVFNLISVIGIKLVYGGGVG